MFEILMIIYFIGVVLSYRTMRLYYGQYKKDFLIKMIWTILGLLSYLNIIGFYIGGWQNRDYYKNLKDGKDRLAIEMEE
jgi:hypothetical protein